MLLDDFVIRKDTQIYQNTHEEVEKSCYWIMGRKVRKMYVKVVWTFCISFVSSAEVEDGEGMRFGLLNIVEFLVNTFSSVSYSYSIYKILTYCIFEYSCKRE